VADPGEAQRALIDLPVDGLAGADELIEHLVMLGVIDQPRRDRVGLGHGAGPYDDDQRLACRDQAGVNVPTRGRSTTPAAIGRCLAADWFGSAAERGVSSSWWEL